MLCLPHSICYDDPSLQRLLRAVEDAPTFTTLILAAWQVARVLPVQLVEAVRTARACPLPAWPPCPACASLLRRQGFAWRQLTSLCGPIRGRRRVGRCPQGCAIPQVAPWDAALGAAVSADQWGGVGPRLCLGHVCPLCHGARAELVLWRRGPCARRMGGGANRWPPCPGAAPGGPSHGGAGTRTTARAAGGGACRLALGSGG
jgi:hypothetical protein